jgi:hypothetical protein
MSHSIRIEHLQAKPGALSERPELATLIATIAVEWNQVEQEMIMLFCYGLLPAEPAIASAVLGCTSNLATKLQMVRTSLSLGVSEKCGDAFWKGFEQKIRKAAKPRNLIVHGIWTIHEDYPDGLIRTGGLSDPLIQAELYRKEDFLGIVIRLAELQLALKQFSMSLPQDHPRPDASERPKYWRIAMPDTPASDDPDRQDRTDP